jgi:hypothetical protein
MGAMNKYFQIDTLNSLLTVEYNQSERLSCNITNGGGVEAHNYITGNDGVEIETIVVGTPDKFTGVSIITTPKQAPIRTQFDSTNLNPDSDAGSSAALAKAFLRECWSKITPSV